MRLAALRWGHGPVERAFLAFVGRATGADPTDVLRLLCYRPRFFGAAMAGLAHDVLRGPSEWTVGERELMAAFVSRVNQCPFCAGGHQKVAGTELDGDLVASVLEDYRTAPIDEALRATLGLLVVVTRDPEAVSGADVDAVRRAGVSDDAIRDALYICMLFNVMNRLANALGFDMPEPRFYGSGVRLLYRRGYRLPPPVVWFSRRRGLARAGRPQRVTVEGLGH